MNCSLVLGLVTLVLVVGDAAAKPHYRSPLLHNPDTHEAVEEVARHVSDPLSVTRPGRGSAYWGGEAEKLYPRDE